MLKAQRLRHGPKPTKEIIVVKFKSTRRQILARSTLVTAGLYHGISALHRWASADPMLAPTPPQTSGPFYPVQDQLDKDADMTQVNGHTKTALGEAITVEGTVLDVTTGRPISGALIEFWQACASGRYDHPQDPNPAPLDPDFQYWAQVRTGPLGEFSIRTVIPGAYPATPDWMRPPHIHVRVNHPNYRVLTTQLYFKGHPLNSGDRILQDLSKEQQDFVTLDLKNNVLAKPWTCVLVPLFQSPNRNKDSSNATPSLP
jgi:protocatechuate 3,4-dioxygenase beta subunit